MSSAGFCGDHLSDHIVMNFERSRIMQLQRELDATREQRDASASLRKQLAAALKTESELRQRLQEQLKVKDTLLIQELERGEHQLQHAIAEELRQQGLLHDISEESRLWRDRFFESEERWNRESERQDAFTQTTLNDDEPASCVLNQDEDTSRLREELELQTKQLAETQERCLMIQLSKEDELTGLRANVRELHEIIQQMGSEKAGWIVKEKDLRQQLKKMETLMREQQERHEEQLEKLLQAGIRRPLRPLQNAGQNCYGQSDENQLLVHEVKPSLDSSTTSSLTAGQSAGKTDSPSPVQPLLPPADPECAHPASEADVLAQHFVPEVQTNEEWGEQVEALAMLGREVARLREQVKTPTVMVPSPLASPPPATTVSTTPRAVVAYSSNPSREKARSNACLGIEVKVVNAPALSGGAVLVVSNVRSQSPGDVAGIRKGDELRRWNGRPLMKKVILEQQLKLSRPGDVIALDVVRHGQGGPSQTITLSVCLGASSSG
eukprot:NODE_865_length_1855_cov_29.390919_g773_i0.p1 GENE.NODE_865_length_1855_cov_29.390919_g773_i0~~NODE_865_length_1855_cov_29.390919_g773_i0.p1  ORF type:complete len:495 (-),score=122.76 NODE_865_length_1855_cov_29.390919_g773_i0:173-1657(-)